MILYYALARNNLAFENLEYCVSKPRVCVSMTHLYVTTICVRMAMHNYEIRHGDLINSHNIRAYKVSKMLYARADVRVCVCVCTTAPICRHLICAFPGDGTQWNEYTLLTRQFQTAFQTP